MIKKLTVAVLLVLFLVTPLMAESIFLPSGPRAISLYDFNRTHQWWNGVALVLLGYKDLVYLDGGLMTVIEQTTPAVGLSANIPNLISLIPGIELNISEPLTFGYAVSYNLRDGYWMSGIYVTIKL